MGESLRAVIAEKSTWCRNGLPGVKWSKGMDTALYKNTPFLFY